MPRATQNIENRLAHFPQIIHGLDGATGQWRNVAEGAGAVATPQI